MRGQSNPISKETKQARIGIDLLGSDTDPDVLFHAVLAFAKDLDPALSLILFGTEELFLKVTPPERTSFVKVPEVITMDDDPLSAIRQKKNSSLSQGILMLQRKEIDAFVSAGNTGALIAMSILSLSMLPGIDRPALLTLLPTKSREMAVLDVGANTTFKTDHIFQFAQMGIAFQKTRGKVAPTVGLLNIGSEEKKGTPEHREAYQKLQLLNIESTVFVGNIEGRDVFQGNIDVLVTDGFTGNVFLKTSEGTSAFILDELQKRLPANLPSAFTDCFQKLRTKLHYAEYPGALLCGVDGIVMKCHGDSTPQSLIHSIQGAKALVQNSFLEKIKSQLMG